MGQCEKTIHQLMDHGLLERDLLHIRAAAAALPKIEEVVLFGSRAKGTYQDASDVDLSIYQRKRNYAQYSSKATG
ncbi:MAG: nucleotidyltransferase domain-containing protein [Cyanobacteria bacterium J06626_6]